MAAGLTLAVVGMSDSARAATSYVFIVGFSFQPSPLKVNVGDTVICENHSSTLPGFHTTTSTTTLWNSGPLASGQTFSFTFTGAGTFDYVCTIHPGMAWTVIVGGGGPTPTSTPPPSPSRPTLSRSGRTCGSPWPAMARIGSW